MKSNQEASPSVLEGLFLCWRGSALITDLKQSLLDLISNHAFLPRRTHCCVNSFHSWFSAVEENVALQASDDIWKIKDWQHENDCWNPLTCACLRRWKMQRFSLTAAILNDLHLSFVSSCHVSIVRVLVSSQLHPTLLFSHIFHPCARACLIFFPAPLTTACREAEKFTESAAGSLFHLVCSLITAKSFHFGAVWNTAAHHQSHALIHSFQILSEFHPSTSLHSGLGFDLWRQVLSFLLLVKKRGSVCGMGGLYSL